MNRALRVAGSVLVTGLFVAYVVWKIDIGRAAHEVASADLRYLAAAVGIMAVSVLPMAWRWQRLLAAKGVRDGLGWLVRAYFVSYAVGQVLPTALGGDASRIFEASRRHPGNTGPIAGSVLLERALGGIATLLLAAVGFALAVGRYDVGVYLWLEAAFFLAAVAAAVIVFARWARQPLRRFVPLLRRLRVERPLRAVYEGVHGYRDQPGLLVGMLALTVFVQTFRVLAIWLTGKAVGVDLSPRPYYVMGPLLFLVMLVPLTVNGFGARESFFVNFLGKLHVRADPAFATGFLFFLVTIALSVPGAVVLLWESLRGGARYRAAA